MKKSLLLLASFAGLVACFGEKKPAEGQEATTTETCPADAAPATEAAATPAAETAPAAAEPAAEAAK